MDKENGEKENLEVEIFGGEEKKKVKGGKYFKKEYTFFAGDELGRKIFGEGQYSFYGGKEHRKGKHF